MKISKKIDWKHYCLVIIITAVVFLVFFNREEDVVEEFDIQYPFPEATDGAEKGLSAVYAGVIDEYMLFMGGCNFPDVPAADGGKKRFYKAIYAARIPATTDTILQWKKLGDIEEASAYGVSVSMLGGVVCVGGVNGEGSLSTANIIMLDKDSMEVLINPLPDLPVTLDNMGGAVMDTMLYVAGGNANGVPSNRVFLLDFTNLQAEWIELPSFPGEPRVQPVCAVMTNEQGEKSLYIWGGSAPSVNGSEPSVSPTGYRYSFRQGEWIELSSPKIANEEIFLGGAAVTAINDTIALFTGGVNKDIFLKALQREADLKRAISQNDITAENRLRTEAREYMLQSPEWYKFNNRVLLYNSLRNNWEEIFVTQSMARAGAALLYKEGCLYSIGGELKPGVRVPEVAAVSLNR